jgi:uncharacterized membrane protein
MPNLGFLFVHFLYHAALALWLGGAIVLGALVAPRLFRALPRHEAGAIFGPALRVFARMRLVTIVIAIAAAAVMQFLWQSATPWMLLRWIALGFMAATVLYEIGYLEKALEARRVHLTPSMAEDDPKRRGFNQLHKRAETLLKLATLAAGVAMFLS